MVNFSAPSPTELRPRIVVFGVGGAGGNAVNNMIESDLKGVEFVVANTDAQQLQFAKTNCRIQLGAEITQGLGAGAHPEVGTSAAEEAIPEIQEHLEGAHMVFITAGMGGGTGTGAAPIIARAARERGILTVGVVTKPFNFEGRHRMRLADQGVLELQRVVDTLIVIPNQNLFRIANERTTFAEAFNMADQVLHSGVRSITDLMVLPGLINLDFADVRTVMAEMGKAMMGTGEASGEDRALMAARNAIQNPLLDEVSLKGARAVLINITGGLDMTLLEVDEAANAISAEVDADANIIFGAAFESSLEGKIRVSVVATGMQSETMASTGEISDPSRTTSSAHRSLSPQSSLSVSRGATVSPRPVVKETASFSNVNSGHTATARGMATQPVSATPPPPLTYDFVASDDATSSARSGADMSFPQLQSSLTQETALGSPQIIKKIVDPLVEEDESSLALERSRALEQSMRSQRSYNKPTTPSLPDPRVAEPKKGGWLSLFGGRPRYEAPSHAPSHSGKYETEQRSSSEPNSGTARFHETASPSTNTHEDLEIPSFLRRLAN